MVMIMKKSLAVFLCLIFIAGILAACSGKEAQESDNLKITIDTHYADMDESTVRAYEKLCNAVLAGENEIKFNIAMSGDVTKLFYTCFPLYPLVSSINYNEDSTGFVIEYFHSQEEHLNLVKQFEEKINSIVEECGYGKVNRNQYIFNVYRYMCDNVSIDDSVTSTYETVMQGKGVSAAVNSMFEYIVLQGGGEASHVLNYSGESKIISLVKFNGTWFYFDTAAEISDNTGALTQFAMDEERAGTGFKFTDNEDVFEVGDNSYSRLALSQSYTEKSGEITVLCSDGKDFLLKFN